MKVKFFPVIFLFISLFISISSGTAGTGDSLLPVSSQSEKLDIVESTLIDLSLGRYKLVDARYKEVYGKGNEIYTLAVYQFFKTHHRHNFGLSAGIKHFVKKGHSTVTHEEAQLTLLPLFIGASYTLNLKSILPWIEMGADYCLYKEASAIKTTRGSTTGYHVQGGLMIPLPKIKNLKLKLYIRHSKLLAKENITVNLGGLEYGVGLILGLDIF
jgi:hypothetical protein